MAIALKDKIAALPPERQQQIALMTAELIAEEKTLRDLRLALSLTQERMAETLGVGQESISRLEKRSDLLISTLGSYIKAMGGELRLVAEFPDRQPIVLKGLVSMRNEMPPSKANKNQGV
ncbi:MAG: helix-turn-helix domain-containing protein [Methylococcales bacterium]|nr:MAG: helix-turn-helix domain-containing protein [Methylococcales bacterium]